MRFRPLTRVLRDHERSHPRAVRFLEIQLEEASNLASRDALLQRIERRGESLFDVTERVLADMTNLFSAFSGRTLEKDDLPGMIKVFRELFGSLPHEAAFEDFDEVAEKFYERPFYPLVEHAMYLMDVGLDRLHEVLALAERIPITPQGMLCDLGVGPGEIFSALLMRFDGWSGRAYDISAPSVRYAREVLRRRGLSARGRIEIADARRIPENDGGFDLVIATEIIEHVPDPGVLLDEIARVLEPRGRLIASTPIQLPWGPHLSVFESEAEVRSLFERRFAIEELVVRPFGRARLAFGLFERT
jgi:2-polyprenyl-3-methyl-5-hydroxy-6-metoxy-1,4-benzoquinol methylase